MGLADADAAVNPGLCIRFGSIYDIASPHRSRSVSPALSLMVTSRGVPAALQQPAVGTSHLGAEALPLWRGDRTRNKNQPRMPATAMARNAGKPASIRAPIKVSTAIAVRNARTGLSTAATAIHHMAQVGRLLTRMPPADTDLGRSSADAVAAHTSHTSRSSSPRRLVACDLASDRGATPMRC